MDPLTISYCQQGGEPVRREVAAVRIGDEKVWVAETPRSPFVRWQELTPIWRNYDRVWLVLSLEGTDVVCAVDERVLFPGNERGFQLCIRQQEAALHRHEARHTALAAFHDNRDWAWRPNLTDARAPWLGLKRPLTIAPSDYFVACHEQNPLDLRAPRLRPSLLAESAGRLSAG